MTTTPASPPNLGSTYVRLREDSSAELLPVDASFWERLSGGALGSFRNERLVSMHSMDSDWKVWEMHPHGDEVVCLLSGHVTMILALDGRLDEIELAESGSFTIVPRSVWHTAKVRAPSSVLFITAGEGTRHRTDAPAGRSG